ncbi:MAG: hypothetical protein JSS83_16645 [Cyanobacteria bacterium SZAS LIN-3]|nr:hypothetical protein [Cyanobacteria bacterium SZAS LIN-3]
MAMHRLVKLGQIIRLVPGLFVKAGSKTPSVEEVSRAKARAFGKLISPHAGDTAVRLELTARVPGFPTFDTAGGGSLFFYQGVPITIKSTANRKLQLKDTEFGELVRAVWHNGREKFDRKAGLALHEAFKTFDKSLWPAHSQWMPAWINDRLF